MRRGAALTSGMWIYFRSQVRRRLKTNKQGEFNLLLREVCRADLKRRRRDNDTIAFAAGKFRLIWGSGVSFRDVGGFFEDATFKDFNAFRRSFLRMGATLRVNLRRCRAFNNKILNRKAMKTDKFELVWVTNRRLSDDFFADVAHVVQGGKADKILLRESDLSEREYEILARNTLEVIAKYSQNARLIVHTYADVAGRSGICELHLPFAKFIEACASGGLKFENSNAAKCDEICVNTSYLLSDKFDKACGSDKARMSGQNGERGLSLTSKSRKFTANDKRTASELNLTSPNSRKFDEPGINATEFEHDIKPMSPDLSKSDEFCADVSAASGERRLNLTDLFLAKFDDACFRKGGIRAPNLTQKRKIGVSVHSLEEALSAQELGADYVVAGHVFDTPSHTLERGRGLKFLREICEKLNIKTYAIGGINFENLNAIKDAGAAGAYMMRGFLS